MKEQEEIIQRKINRRQRRELISLQKEKNRQRQSEGEAKSQNLNLIQNGATHGHSRNGMNEAKTMKERPNTRLEEVKECQQEKEAEERKSMSDKNDKQKFLRSFHSKMRSSTLFKSHLELKQQRFFHGITTYIYKPRGKWYFAPYFSLSLTRLSFSSLEFGQFSYLYCLSINHV